MQFNRQIHIQKHTKKLADCRKTLLSVTENCLYKVFQSIEKTSSILKCLYSVITKLEENSALVQQGS